MGRGKPEVIDLCASSARPIPRETRATRGRRLPAAEASTNASTNASTVHPTHPVPKPARAAGSKAVYIDLCTPANGEPAYDTSAYNVEEPTAKRPRSAADCYAAPGVGQYLASIDRHIADTESHGAARGHGAFLGIQPNM